MTMRHTLGRAVLTNVVDRLERAPSRGAVRVIDYKTGSKPKMRVARHPQLRCYQVALEAERSGQAWRRAARRWSSWARRAP